MRSLLQSCSNNTGMRREYKPYKSWRFVLMFKLLIVLCFDASSALIQSRGCFTNGTDTFATPENSSHGLASVVDYKNVTFSFTLFNETRCAEMCQMEEMEYTSIAVVWQRAACGTSDCPESLHCTCGNIPAGQWRKIHRYGCPFPCNERVSLEVPGLWCVMYHEWTVPTYSRVFQNNLTESLLELYAERDNSETSGSPMRDLMGSITGVFIGIILFIGIGLGILLLVYKTGHMDDNTGNSAGKCCQTEHTRLMRRAQEDQL